MWKKIQRREEDNNIKILGKGAEETMDPGEIEDRIH